MSHPPQNQPIAIVGVSALFPGSVAREGFWRDLLAGRDLIEDVPEGHWRIEDYYDADPSARDKVYAKRGGFLPKVTFDPMKWGVPPTIMPATDTTQLLALIVAQRVLDDALAGQFGEALRERTSVILGVTSAQELLGTMVSRLQRPVWQKALREMGLPESEVKEACDRIAGHYVEWQESTFPGVLGNVVAGRIANRLDLGGSNCVTDAACASSFSAISMGVNELRLGQSDLVIAGGADTMNDIFMYMCFSKTPALSPTGDCRPFSDRADGTLLGEGIGMFAFERLEDAEQNGHRVYAVLRGLGASSDGRSKSVYAPVAEGQARALRRAYEQAGYGPGSVELIEAHGTGTKAGDAAEVGGLKLVFEEGRDDAPTSDAPWCALGTVKSQIGHTKAAAGAAGLFKVVMALHHKALPPTIKVDAPNPALGLDDSPFYLNTEARPWIRRGDHPRRAGVSSFGFGGSNFHITVEEPEGRKAPPRLRTMPQEMVLLGDADVDGLVASCRRLAAEVRAHRERAEAPDDMLRWLAYDSQRDFDATAPCRLAVLATDDDALAEKLDNAATMVAEGKPFRSPTGIHFGLGDRDGGVAALFPGQGSQYLGMGGALAIAHPEAIGAWDVANAVVPGLADTVFPPPAFDAESTKARGERLRATEWAQPAIGAASLAQWRLLEALELGVDAFAGHSFGEIMALCAAGALSATEALRIARRRGELMAAAASTPGAMLSVRGAVDEVERTLPDGVTVANHNAPDQVVVSGATAAIEIADSELKKAGFSTKRLDVATAFHSSIVAGAVGPFREYLAERTIVPPTGTVTSNETAAPYEREPDAIRERLAGQIAARVRFVEQIEALYADGIRTFVEVGPGHVLTQLVGRILGDRPHRALSLDRRGRDAVVSFTEGLAQLSVAGVSLKLAALWEAFATPSDPRERPAPKMAVTLTGTSYGKVYPPPEGAPAMPKPNPERAPVAAPVATSARATEEPGDSLPARDRPATTPPSATSSEWLQAFEIAQRQAADAQASFERTLAESHANYLRESQVSLAMLGRALGQDVPLPSGVADDHAEVRPAMSAPELPAVEAPPTPSAEAAPVPPAAPAADRASTQPAVDLRALMLEIVADATGYPAEMLGLEMDLEADLGIDSIKRVEILSSLKKRAPDLPDVPTTEIAKLATLGAVLSMYDGAAPTPREAVAPSAPADAHDVEALVLEAVADKTGYPVEMLGMEMALEADLGIDSIKRVEILSSVRNRAPDLPEVPARELGTLVTLGEVVARMRRALDVGVAAPAAEAVVSIDSARATDLSRRVVELTHRPAPGVATSGLRAGHLAVVDDGAGLAAHLADLLAAAGLSASVVNAPDALHPETDALILLAPADIDDPIAVSRHALGYARRLASRARLLVTVQHTGGDFGRSAFRSIASAGLIALARCARLEWPDATVRGLDVALTDERTAAEAIARELLGGGDAIAVGLPGDGRRLVPADVLSDEEPAGELSIGPSDVVLASGGGRGVTAAAMVALAQRSRAAFVLLGRSALRDEDDVTSGVHDDAALKRALLAAAQARGETVAPASLGREVAAIRSSRQVRETLAAIEAAGGRARYVTADVTDARSLALAVAEARAAFGPITALVHGAGVLADKAIADKTDEQLERVMATKVAGLEAMLEAAGDDPLGVIALFSSVAARYGNAGQSDYAMANEILNQRARQLAREREGLVVRSLDWGPWRGGMVSEGLAAMFAERGVGLIELDAGARAFVSELCRPANDDPEVVLGVGLDSAGVSAETSPRLIDVFLDPVEHAYLDDHRMRGAMVLPIASAVELFGRACREAYPELTLQRLSSLRVLSGVTFDRPLTKGAWLTVEIEQKSNGDGATVALRLITADGRPRYAAVAELDGEPAVSHWRSVRGANGNGAAHRAPYGGVLFHGPSLQVLEQVTSIDGAGASADMRGNGLPMDGFVVDAGLLDGALQLALLWTEERLGGASLPTAIGRLELHQLGPVDAPVCAELVADDATADRRGVCDVHLRRADGLPIATLRGVETHLLPPVAASVRAPRP